MRTLVGTLAILALSACTAPRAVSVVAGDPLPPSPREARRHSAVSAVEHARDLCVGTARPDVDRDGLADGCEALLGEMFAPVMYHSSDESNFPTNVDAFLASSALGFYDDECTPDLLSVGVARAPHQADLLGHTTHEGCGLGTVLSSGTRSRHKHRTFFLADLPRELRTGEPDSRAWTTYLHAYPSTDGGITLQYWRIYPYNDAANDHGGDWEGIHIVLDRTLHPASVRLLGHSSMRELPASAITWERTHPRVFSEGGGHGSRASGEGIFARGCVEEDPCSVDPARPSTFVRQETWPGGHVWWPSGAVTVAGPLVDVGEKRAPKNGQVFVSYSGLWGSPGAFYMTSGYWGPAYNETGMREDGFSEAWCAGMVGGDVAHECFPRDQSR
jgi:hypothetical protein